MMCPAANMMRPSFESRVQDTRGTERSVPWDSQYRYPAGTAVPVHYLPLVPVRVTGTGTTLLAGIDGNHTSLQKQCSIPIIEARHQSTDRIYLFKERERQSDKTTQHGTGIGSGTSMPAEGAESG